MNPLSSITLDQDDTLINTNTKNALYNYLGEKSAGMGDVEQLVKTTVSWYNSKS